VRWMTLQQADLLIRELGPGQLHSRGLRQGSGRGRVRQEHRATQRHAGGGQRGRGCCCVCICSWGWGVRGGAPGVPQLSELWVEEVGRQSPRSKGRRGRRRAMRTRRRPAWRAGTRSAHCTLWTSRSPSPCSPLPPMGPPRLGMGMATGTGTGVGMGPRGGWLWGEERTSGAFGYLSELTAAVFACRVSHRLSHTFSFCTFFNHSPSDSACPTSASI